MDLQTDRSKAANTDKNSTDKETKYLVFRLATEQYAIPLSTVREVIGNTDTTRVPHTPNHFFGVINLRGKIVSIFDFRTKLNLPKLEDECHDEDSIIIVETGGYSYGVIVDDVVEVLAYKASQIETDVDISNRFEAKAIIGVMKTDEMTMLLNVGRIFHGGIEQEAMNEALRLQIEAENARTQAEKAKPVESEKPTTEAVVETEEFSFGIFDEEEEQEKELEETVLKADEPQEEEEDTTDTVVTASSILVPTDTILNLVAEIFDTTVEEIKSPKRVASLIQPRQFCSYLIRQFTNLSFREIATVLERKDHTTIMAAVEKLEKALKSDKQAQDLLEILLKRLDEVGKESLEKAS